MLPKQNRLTTNYEYRLTRFLAQKLSQKKSSKNLTIYYLSPNNYKGDTKIGIVVSNKIHKNATTRNKLKRRYRAILRDQISNLKPNYWIVVHPRLSSLELSHEELSSEVITLLQGCSLTR